MHRRSPDRLRSTDKSAGKRPLNDRERRFCALYAVSMHGSDSAKGAGFPARSARQRAYELLDREDIRAEVKRQAQVLCEKAEISAEWVLKQLKENAERAMTEANRSAANTALELLGKTVGLWVKPTQLNVNANLSELTDAQLEHLANGGDLAGLPVD